MGRRRASKEPPDLDVTTFMNLMVVLIPFLLLSAAFSELTIHDLNLPTLGPASSAIEQKKLNLEVVVRKDLLDVLDRERGRLKLIQNTKDGHDYLGLNGYLRELKQSYPNTTDVTLLVETDVQYAKLISTMDAVKTFPEKVNGAVVQRDLFPDVSIGDAPKVTSGG